MPTAKEGSRTIWNIYAHATTCPALVTLTDELKEYGMSEEELYAGVSSGHLHQKFLGTHCKQAPSECVGYWKYVESGGSGGIEGFEINKSYRNEVIRQNLKDLMRQSQ
ncbi:hypothetical protein D3C71_1598730 [compost metagenome]